jgi:hypothetical protein
VNDDAWVGEMERLVDDYYRTTDLPGVTGGGLRPVLDLLQEVGGSHRLPLPYGLRIQPRL